MESVIEKAKRIESSSMDDFKKDLTKHKRRLAKKMNTYIKFLEDNGIQMSLSDQKEKVEHVFLCREVCAKKWAK